MTLAPVLFLGQFRGDIGRGSLPADARFRVHFADRADVHGPAQGLNGDGDAQPDRH